MSDDEFKRIFKYSATESSLDIAEAIAKSLGQSFDRDAVAKQSEDYLENIFSDLLDLLEIDPSTISFQSGIYPKARTFAALTKEGENHVVMDMVFEFWISSATQINTIIATQVLETNTFDQIGKITEEIFSLFSESHRFKVVREKFLPLMLDYPDCLNLSHALSRSMTLFVMCHEIAHCQLDHLHKTQSRELELQADKLAAEYFLKIVLRDKSQIKNSAFIDPKVAAAPILLMRLLETYEIWQNAKGIDISLSSSHPKAVERIDTISPIIQPNLDEKALHILDGMSKALEDLNTSFS